MVKSKTNHVICGGIAEYVTVDPVIIRLVFVVLVLTDGFFILLYIILAIIMPETKQTNLSQKEIMEKNVEKMAQQVKGAVEKMENEIPKQQETNNARWLGVILVLLGAYFLLESFNHHLSGVSSDQIWPLLLILIGIGLLFRRTVR